MSNPIAEQAAPMSARCRPSQGSPRVAACEHTLRIGFFFDGFGRHRSKDLQSKLYMAPSDYAEDKALVSYRKFYASGLGEDFSADLNVIANSALASFGSTASDVPAEVAEDQAIEATKYALDSKRTWWERISNDLKGLLRNPFKLVGLLKGAAINASLELLAPCSR